jgi:hypothetical protein
MRHEIPNEMIDYQECSRRLGGMFTIEEGSPIYYRLRNTGDHTASGVKVAARAGAFLPDREDPSREDILTLDPDAETLLVLAKPFRRQALEVTWDGGSELVPVPNTMH